jgi:hypothetical protein
MRILLTIIVAVTLTLPVTAGQVRQLGWEDLVPDIRFDDPFEALTREQLGMLAFVARIRTELAAGTVLSEETRRETAELEKELAAEGVDIDGLLTRRDEIRRLRTMRGTRAVSELDGMEIKMPGFVLPLEFAGRKVTEFLLVPWIGACIHTPPPPPNQIVHVVLDEKQAFESKGRFEPVWVAGRMQNETFSVNLFLKDGAGDIPIAYRLRADLVETYQK